MTTAILCLIFLILLSAFFSSSETGMMAINRYRMQHLASEGNQSAALVLKLLARPDRLLGVILIGNTFANILASSIATLIAIHYAGDAGIAIATLLLTLAVLIFAEVAPKTMAAHYPDQYARLVAWPLYVLLTLLYPLVALVNGISNFLLTLFGLHHKKDSTVLSDEELRTVVDSTQHTLSSENKEMLLSVFDLKKTSVTDIMVPRNEIEGIDIEDPLETLITQIKHSEHTRLPLYCKHINQLIGVLHGRKMVDIMSTPNVTKENLMQAAIAPYFIPEEVSLNQQLLRFQKHQQRLAFVVDEYGEIQGLITIDDILEEIVGEFTTDNGDTSNDIYPQIDGSHFLEGAITIRELNRELELNWPTDGPKTLNGLILEKIETLPKTGMKISLHGHPIEIIEVADNRVKTAKLRVC